MTTRRITKPALPTNAQISKFINKCIKERLEWASSPEGREYLVPGSPTIPGLQDYYQVLAYVEGRKWPD